jgi:hypothetical protein
VAVDLRILLLDKTIESGVGAKVTDRMQVRKGFLSEPMCLLDKAIQKYAKDIL